MRPNGKHLDNYRKIHPTMGLSQFGALYGYFRIRQTDSVLSIISSGERYAHSAASEWEHVSVSIYQKADRLPTWEEMAHVKDLFWTPEETVVQFHPAESEYVDVAQVLHLWKPPYELALPPAITLAPPELAGAERNR